MANYLLVENRQIVHLGPYPWRTRFIQSELDDLEVDFQLPQAEQGYIKINDNFEIFPVGEAKGDAGDSNWHDPVGPFWEYVDNVAIPTFDKKDKPLEQIRDFLKNIVADQRYSKEISGTKVDLDGKSVTVNTSRDNRSEFSHVHSTMSESEKINWKFPEGWTELTKSQLFDVSNSIHKIGRAHV